GGLAVRPREVEHRILVLRVAQQLGQPAHPVEGGRHGAGVGHHPGQVDVVVEPRPRLLEIHAPYSPRMGADTTATPAASVVRTPPARKPERWVTASDGVPASNAAAQASASSATSPSPSGGASTSSTNATPASMSSPPATRAARTARFPLAAMRTSRSTGRVGSGSSGGACTGCAATWENGMASARRRPSAATGSAHHDTPTPDTMSMVPPAALAGPAGSPGQPASLSNAMAPTNRASSASSSGASVPMHRPHEADES